jgi:hypothetical protein
VELAVVEEAEQFDDISVVGFLDRDRRVNEQGIEGTL